MPYLEYARDEKFRLVASAFLFLIFTLDVIDNLFFKPISVSTNRKVMVRFQGNIFI